MPQQGPTIRIGAKEYDVNRDFTWRELLTVEELGGQPLARDDAFESFGGDEPDEAAKPAAKAKARPTKSV
jgi:hypothetical protein